MCWECVLKEHNYWPDKVFARNSIVKLWIPFRFWPSNRWVSSKIFRSRTTPLPPPVPQGRKYRQYPHTLSVHWLIFCVHRSPLDIPWMKWRNGDLLYNAPNDDSFPKIAGPWLHLKKKLISNSILLKGHGAQSKYTKYTRETPT
jgi:hypothetical protein